MNRKKLSIICGIACIAIISISTLFILTNNKPDNKKTKHIRNTKPVTLNNSTVLEQNDLDFSFLKLNNNEENMVYSPLSIKYAFNMLRDGACSDTKDELDTIFGNNKLTTYNNIPNVLSLANGVFINNEFKNNIKESYITSIKEKYKADVKYDSFKNADNINKWIEEKTMGIINDMVYDSDVEEANYTLINALAIDMEWKHDIFTENECLFNYKDNRQRSINALTASVNNKDILYSNNDDVISVSIPLKKYNDVQLEYLAIMPQNTPLKDYIDSVSRDEINNIIEKQIPTSSDAEIDNVIITLPVYNYNYFLDVDTSLQALGIKQLYEKPDLSNISDSFVDGVKTIHNADITFSKKGIKAAAFTMIIVDGSSCEITNDIYLRFTKPYMYIIRDKTTHEIWFVGTVYEPERVQ